MPTRPLDVIPDVPDYAMFGEVRMYDRHTGIDLHVPEGTEVRAVRTGQVVAIAPFTGARADSPWWHETDYVGIVDADLTSRSYIVYGEIEPLVSVGDAVAEGDVIGRVKRVLKNDKGKPTSVLHLEHYSRFVADPVVWKLGDERPKHLLDPLALVKDVRFNRYATTFLEARAYLENRAQQMAHDGVELAGITEIEEGVVAEFVKDEKRLVSIYLYPRFRGQGLYPQIVERLENPTIVTIDDCDLIGYLTHPMLFIDHVVVAPFLQSAEYRKISNLYGDRKARRSGQFYMKHIDEGLTVLRTIGADETTMRAWCLHPVVQRDEDLAVQWNRWWHDTSIEAIVLAMEYRSVANEYLAHRTITDPSEIRLSPLKRVNQMLYADKVQNFNDLAKHNLGHPRFAELCVYFSNWLKRLEGVI